jgi:HPt (histidine-containing phosphotransfer) domain-containing protein
MPGMKRSALEACDEDIARLYLKTASDQLGKMGIAARSKSMAEVQRLAHNLSGASAFLGLKKMAKLLCGLEQAAMKEHSKEANRFIERIKEEFGHTQRRCGLHISGDRAPGSMAGIARLT